MRPLEVISTPLSLGSSDDPPPANCVRQVLGGGNEVVIHLSQIEIDSWDQVPDGYQTNFARSRALVPLLRQVGRPSPPPCA